ncbi:MAG: alpha/beta hydrolase [Bacteroidales bacterium]|nr:alpha/beta hydrolase [Bacteroidales bacterium]
MKKLFATTLILVIAVFTSFSQSTDKAGNKMADKKCSYLYAEKDGESLWMDEYTQQGEAKGTIIFIFGGGFKEGKRDARLYRRWFYHLNENGYKVYSIDYRLGLKDGTRSGIGMIKDIDGAISLGIEDLFDATKYIVENAKELGVDPDKIIVSGSSAGAMLSLHADWLICNEKQVAKSRLPEGFRYSAVMPFAGAILSHEWAPKYKNVPAPTCFFHGTADKVVNYNKLQILNVGIFGGKNLAKHFAKKGYNYNFYKYKGCGHEIATAFLATLPEQLEFLEINVNQGQKKIVDALIDDPKIKKGTSYKNRRSLYKN